MQEGADAIKRAAAEVEKEAAQFLREMIRIPSPSGDEAEVVAAAGKKMKAVGFDEVHVDPFGNLLGRIGTGSRVLAFDAHLDAVDVGDPRLWKVDPFGAEMRDGVIYGRGASDQKGGMAALVYAGAALRQLDIVGDVTVWVVGSVLEEACEGLCWHYILREGLLAPEVVILTEPTELQVYRGQRGRMEIAVTTHGISCHGSAHERGLNAIHQMAPIIGEIEQLNGQLTCDPFLGRGSVTTSEVCSTAPSRCAVADSCTIHLDRRLTGGESDESAVAEIEEILRRVEAAHAETTTEAGGADIEIPVFERPSHTGLTCPMRQYFPAWVIPESHRFVRMAARARELSLGTRGAAGKWTFSTNGVATMGLHGVPTIGFGPASEIHAHAPTDQCPVEHLSSAIAFYVTFVALFAGQL